MRAFANCGPSSIHIGRLRHYQVRACSQTLGRLRSLPQYVVCQRRFSIKMCHSACKATSSDILWSTLYVCDVCGRQWLTRRVLLQPVAQQEKSEKTVNHPIVLFGMILIEVLMRAEVQIWRCGSKRLTALVSSHMTVPRELYMLERGGREEPLSISLGKSTRYIHEFNPCSVPIQPLLGPLFCSPPYPSRDWTSAALQY